MPVKSEKQRRFMAAVANNPEFAKKVGVPTKVGKEFMKTTKKYKEKMQEGGKVKKNFKDNEARELFLKAANEYPESKASEKSVQKDKPIPPKKKMRGGGKVKKGYKSGGTVRGYGMARGGKVCKIVSMKGI
jgi:hypothetical protein